jgi:hypothetical protein
VDVVQKPFKGVFNESRAVRRARMENTASMRERAIWA